MELFERVKTLLVKPKDEWMIIEAENAPHAKVFTGYLLILALIPAIAIFANYWWTWHSAYTEAITRMSAAYGRDMADIIAMVKAQNPFVPKWGIIYAVQQTVIIIGGAYIAAALINALSDQFGAAKDFNRTFALAAYSYTPLCVAGLLYFYSPLAGLVPYIGLYGIYLLYLGSDTLLRPAADKKTLCFIIATLASVIVFVVLTKIVPEITNSILIEQAKSGDAIKNMQKMIPR